MIIWLLAQAALQVPPSVRLPTGIELTGPTAIARLECVNENALVDMAPKTLTENQRHLSIEFSPQGGQQAKYKDFYYRDLMPVSWTSNPDTLSFYLTADSEEKHAEIWFASRWREDGKITFKSVVMATFKGQKFKAIVLDRSGSCKLLIDMHPDSKQ